MNRKLAVTIVFFFLGLATWDAFLDHDANVVETTAAEVRTLEDGTPLPKN